MVLFTMPEREFNSPDAPVASHGVKIMGKVKKI